MSKIANSLTKEEIGKYIMNGVKDFTKLLTQVLKKSTILEKDIEGKDKISKANRVVKQTIEQLKPNNEQSKTLNIPNNLINKENIESLVNNIRKFLK